MGASAVGSSVLTGSVTTGSVLSSCNMGLSKMHQHMYGYIQRSYYRVEID
jgi:hypothetical protein